MSPTGVVHITAAEGGGADRYIRDLAANTAARHWIWHAAADVIEDVAGYAYYAPGSVIDVARWLTDAGIGLIHLHGLGTACRTTLARVQSASARGPLPYLVTLHDVQFVLADAFARDALDAVDAAHIARLKPVLTGAAAVVAPSAFIAGLAHTHYGIDTVRIEPGVRLSVRAAPASVSAPMMAVGRDGERVVAVVGAVGPHKGSELLAPIAAALQAVGASLVVIGYTDLQVERGRDASGRYFVHGPYEDAELPTLLDAYGVDVVLFPNRLPESFSYTLSEAWAAQRPVIVPDQGALGERVASLGGGWRLPPRFTAQDVGALMQSLASPAAAPAWAEVKSALHSVNPVRVPLLSAMAESFDALYREFAQHLPAGTTPAAALQALVTANLDGAAFRRELTDLAHERAEQREWVAKLTHDIAGLKDAVAALEQRNRELEDMRAAFEQLPLTARKALFKWAFRGRG